MVFQGVILLLEGSSDKTRIILMSNCMGRHFDNETQIRSFHFLLGIYKLNPEFRVICDCFESTS
jgi:hypothetical protein